MKKLSLLMTLVMLVSLFGVASPAPVAADPTPGRVIQIPVIQVGSGWETWIQVQNVGVANTKFALLLFGYSGPYCGPQCLGPMKVEFSGRVPPGAAWTYKLSPPTMVDCALKPFSPTSGILISLSMEQAEWLEFQPCSTARSAVHCLWVNSFSTFIWCLTFPAGYPAGLRVPRGEPAAVSVNRIMHTGGTPRAAAYTGIADWEMETGPDPRTGAYMYYAPQLFDTFSPAGWSSRIWIMNSGIECTSLEIWFQKQQDCLKARIQEVLSLCPGETIAVDPELPGFLGSAWIRASQPLGIVVDEYNANGSILMSYRGMPAEYWGGGTEGSLFNFAPLIYREYNGWNTGIQVQNLSSVFNALVKVYFIDNSGDIIDTIVDWICPRGSQTFYLPAINNLPGQYVGQARVESQNWWGPGDPPVWAPNVLSVVNLVNYNSGQGAAYNTFPKHQAMWTKWVALPFLAKDKHDPYEPSGTKWTSEIAMTNLDMTPGTSVWRIDFFDQNGLLYSLCQTLNEKQVDYVKLANIGIIPPGWLGSATISWQCSEPWGVGSLGVVVVEKASGYPSGDLTKAYEGFPLFAAPNVPLTLPCTECYQMPECTFRLCGQVVEALDLRPINGAVIYGANYSHGPFNLSGTAYVGPVNSPNRLANASVQLQRLVGTAWVVAANTTTTGAGWFSFPASLTEGATYRLKIFVATGGNTVSYVSGPFVATGDVRDDFTIQTAGGLLDLATGAWEPAIVTLRAPTLTELTRTDSTGHYCVTLPISQRPERILVRAAGHNDLTAAMPAVQCSGQYQLNFELYPLVDTVWVGGWVTDKETGLPIAGARVCAANCLTTRCVTTNAAGSYSIQMPFDPTCTTWVWAGADGYITEIDSVFIPKGDTAMISFELHQTPRSRVLIYWGNGGPAPDFYGGGICNYSNLAALYTSMGYIVDYTNMWPTDPDLEEYALIVLVLSGDADDTGVNFYTEGQVAQMNTFIANGGRVVVLGNHSGGFGMATQNNLLARLRVDMLFTANVFGGGLTPTGYKAGGIPGPYNLEFVPATVQMAASADLLLANDAFALYTLNDFLGQIAIAADKPGVPNTPPATTTTGWDVIAIADSQVLDNTTVGIGTYPENDAFAVSLISYPTP